MVHQQIKYLVEEFHRGEWSPLMGKDKNGKKVQRRVIITEEEAQSMNKHSSEYKLRYVKADEVIKEIEVVDEEVVEQLTLSEEYQKVFGKKPFHGWDDETLKDKIEAEKAK